MLGETAWVFRKPLAPQSCLRISWISTTPKQKWETAGSKNKGLRIAPYHGLFFSILVFFSSEATEIGSSTKQK